MRTFKTELNKWKLFEIKNISFNCMFSCVEIWITENIVSPFIPESTNNKLFKSHTALINPANKYFCGTSLPYFPIGGPAPNYQSSELNSKWGGMEIGPNMKYPSQAVDGLVHMMGGVTLKQHIQSQYLNNNIAIMTIATERLSTVCGLQYIIHTAPPFANDSNTANELALKLDLCYISAFRLIQERTDIEIVAMPLLGSGTAGFSIAQSCASLNRALHAMHAGNTGKILRVVTQTQELASLVQRLALKSG
jgi:O-acetyl-ADP-ribose deacetylase (regulator of RNase III)